MCFLQLKCRFSGSGGVLHRGGSPSGGSPSQGGSPSWGVLHPGDSPSGGFSIPGGLFIWGVPPSHGALHPRGALHPTGLSISGGSPSGGVPSDLSHHAFDVTCMLPPHQLRHTNCAPAYILPGHVTCNASWDTHPPPWTDRHL